MENFGKFVVKEKIAQGAMGDIFLVEDESSAQFALKTLKAGLNDGEDSESKSRFLREINICKDVDHPNIVKLNSFEMNDELPFMVMEFMENGSLEDLIAKEKSLDPETVLKIALDITKALIEINSHEITHRDIKPANILIDESDTFKLADLGLARINKASQAGNENLTMSQTALGTPYYIAPEQALDAKKADIRSDIYSLGATLYYCLTGKRVHEGNSSVHVMMKHLNEDIEHPDNIKKDLPRNLTGVIMKMLEKDLKKRYQTPAGLLKDLEKIDKFDAPPEDLLASSMAINKSHSSNKTGMVMFSFFIGLILVTVLAVVKFSCLPPSQTDKLYQKARMEMKSVTPVKSSDFLNKRADQLDKFLIDYPNAEDAERIKKASAVGRLLSSNKVYHLTLKKVGNLKAPRSFSFRILIDGKKYEFTTNEKKKLFYPEQRIVFNWGLESEIKLELEEFEWVNDIIYSAKIPNFFTLRSLSGDKVYRVKPATSEYFADGELHVQYELDEISEDDWLAFEEYFYPATAW